MASQIEFYFDFASPYSYLAATQLPALTAATGTQIVYRPFRLLELMKIVGNRPTTIECRNKGKYASADIGRWAARYKVPFQRNPNLRSFDFAALGRGALVAIDQGRGADYRRMVDATKLQRSWGDAYGYVLVATGRAEVSRPWSAHAERANSYFAWRFGLAAAFLGAIAVMVALAVAAAILISRGGVAGAGLGAVVLIDGAQWVARGRKPDPRGLRGPPSRVRWSPPDDRARWAGRADVGGIRLGRRPVRHQPRCVTGVHEPDERTHAAGRGPPHRPRRR
jgi:hypothetical protein